MTKSIQTFKSVNFYLGSAQLLAATTLRNVLGTRNLGDILADREAIAHEMQSGLDDATDSWGVFTFPIFFLKKGFFWVFFLIVFSYQGERF